MSDTGNPTSHEEPGWLWHTATMLAYFVLSASLYLGVSDQLQIKWDSWWLGAFALFGAPLALGVSWRSVWAFVLPLPSAVFSFAALAQHGGGGLGDFMLLLISVPLGVLMIAVGRVVAYGLGRSSWPRAITAVPVALFAIATLPLVEGLRRSTFPRLPAAEQRRLGLDEGYDLASLCYGSERRPRDEERMRELIEVTREHPDSVVKIEYGGSDETTIELKTLRQYGREMLARAPRSCRPDIRSALEVAVR